MLLLVISPLQTDIGFPVEES